LFTVRSTLASHLERDAVISNRPSSILRLINSTTAYIPRSARSTPTGRPGDTPGRRTAVFDGDRWRLRRRRGAGDGPCKRPYAPRFGAARIRFQRDITFARGSAGQRIGRVYCNPGIIELSRSFVIARTYQRSIVTLQRVSRPEH